MESPHKKEANLLIIYILFVVFLADKVCQSIKKFCDFARLALYHVPHAFGGNRLS